MKKNVRTKLDIIKQLEKSHQIAFKTILEIVNLDMEIQKSNNPESIANVSKVFDQFSVFRHRFYITESKYNSLLKKKKSGLLELLKGCNNDLFILMCLKHKVENCMKGRSSSHG